MHQVSNCNISNRMHALSVLLLLAGAALIYGRVGAFGYSGIDDNGYVLYTEAVRRGLSLDGVLWAFTEFHMSNWHPLTWLSYMFDVSLFGLNPGPQHLMSVLIHALNSVLVYLLALRILRSGAASLIVAWLFMAHPLHVESVAWIAERKDVLCGFFFLLAVLAYIRYAARRTVGRYTLVALSFLLALLSKPMAITLPVVLLLLDYWPLARFDNGSVNLLRREMPSFLWLVLEKTPLFLLSLGSGIVTLMAQTTAMAPIEDVPVTYRLMNVVLSWVMYLRDMLLPTRLAVLYPLYPIDFVSQFLPSLFVVMVISVLTVLWRRRAPWLIFGWLWFLVMLLPVIGLVQVGSQARADRYMYLPSLGLLLSLGAVVADLTIERIRRAMLGIVPAMIFYATLAWVQVGYWSGPYMLFSRVNDVVGDNFQSHVSLSVYFLSEGMLSEAEFHAVKAIDLGSDAGIVYANLGVISLTRSQFATAERLFRMALKLSPNDAQIMNNLGISIEEQGRLEEARKYFEAALQQDPNLYKVASNLRRVGG